MSHYLTYFIRDNHLFEAPAKEAAKLYAENPSSVKIVHGTRAHAWVRLGYPHSTNLYLDDKRRVRRAKA